MRCSRVRRGPQSNRCAWCARMGIGSQARVETLKRRQQGGQVEGAWPPLLRDVLELEHEKLRKADLAELGRDSHGCDVPVPVFALPLRLAHDVAHSPPGGSLRNLKVFRPTDQVLQVEGEIILFENVNSQVFSHVDGVRSLPVLTRWARGKAERRERKGRARTVSVRWSRLTFAKPKRSSAVNLRSVVMTLCNALCFTYAHTHAQTSAAHTGATLVHTRPPKVTLPLAKSHFSLVHTRPPKVTSTLVHQKSLLIRSTGKSAFSTMASQAPRVLAAAAALLALGAVVLAATTMVDTREERLQLVPGQKLWMGEHWFVTFSLQLRIFDWRPGPEKQGWGSSRSVLPRGCSLRT